MLRARFLHLLGRRVGVGGLLRLLACLLACLLLLFETFSNVSFTSKSSFQFGFGQEEGRPHVFLTRRRTKGKMSAGPCVFFSVSHVPW